MSGKNILVVAAHLGDFIWRSGGTIAKHSKAGDTVHVVAVTCGLRGESNDIWKEEGMTMDQARERRLVEAKEAAAILGVAKLDIWDYEDYPLVITREIIDRLVIEIRNFTPDFILTHDKEDFTNPDHGLVADMVRRSCLIASGSGTFLEGTKPSARRIPLFGFEPHVSELNSFKPGVFVDITEVFDVKLKAMQCCRSQKKMAENYTLRAQLRANHMNSYAYKGHSKYAEAFASYYPVAQFGDIVY